MRFTALLLASVWALAASLAVPCPKSLRLYFAANLAYTAGTQPFLYWAGETSFAYALAYYIAATIHFAAALNVAREELKRRWHLALGILITVAVVGTAHSGLLAPIHTYQWFALAEGGALVLAGTALGYSAAHSQHIGIMLTLSFLWLALAVFRFGFALSEPSAIWLALNEVLPTVFVCGALGWIGIRLMEGRQESDSLLQ